MLSWTACIAIAPALLCPEPKSPAAEATAQIIAMVAGHHDVEFPSPRPSTFEPSGDSLPNTRVLIVTVPDPTDQPLALSFDRQLDSLLAAIQNAGFALDSKYLPWPTESPPRPHDNAKGIVQGPEKEAGAPTSGVGALLFRYEPSGCPSADDAERCALFSFTLPDTTPNATQSSAIFTVDIDGTRQPDDPRNTSLLVLLVPETPTRGVDKSALNAALDLAHRLDRTPGPVATVHVLGPTYSGSAQSMRLVLDHRLVAHDSERFILISGVATNLDVKARLEDGARNRIIFHATTLPDEVLADSMIYFLREVLRVTPRDIALLVEEDSTYGQGFIGLEKPRSPPHRASRDAGMRIMPFPMGISNLRRKLLTDNQTKGRASEEGVPLARDPLELTLDTGLPTHVPVDRSTATVYSTELRLESILSEIAREKFKYVGIVATEPGDRIFLALRVRRVNPDMTVFFVDNDLLYTHADLADELHGSLVVSTYPLVLSNQDWSYPRTGGRLRSQFPDSASEGVYNAAIAMMGLIGHERPTTKTTFLPFEYGVPLENSVPRDPVARVAIPPTDPDASIHRPLVWISAIGRSSTWPLNAFAPYFRNFSETVCRKSPFAGDCDRLRDLTIAWTVGFRHSSQAAIETVDVLPLPYASILFYVLLCLFGMVHGLSAYLGRIDVVLRPLLARLRRHLSDRWFYRAFVPYERETNRWALGCRLLCLLFLFTLQTIILRWVVFYPWRMTETLSWRSLAFLLVSLEYLASAVSIGLGAAALASDLPHLDSPRPNSGMGRAEALIALLTGISMTVVLWPYDGGYPMVPLRILDLDRITEWPGAISKVTASASGILLLLQAGTDWLGRLIRRSHRGPCLLIAVTLVVACSSMVRGEPGFPFRTIVLSDFSLLDAILLGSFAVTLVVVGAMRHWVTDCRRRWLLTGPLAVGLCALPAVPGLPELGAHWDELRYLVLGAFWVTTALLLARALFAVDVHVVRPTPEAFCPSWSLLIKSSGVVVAVLIIVRLLLPYLVAEYGKRSYGGNEALSAFFSLARVHRQRLFFAFRANAMSSGLSPLLPILFLGACGYVWTLVEIARTRTSERTKVKSHLLEGFRELADSVARILSALRDPFYKLPAASFIVLVGAWSASNLLLRHGPALDGPLFRWFFFALFTACLGCIVFQTLRVGVMWRALSRLLRMLAATPLVEAFGRFPRRYFQDLGRRLANADLQRPDVDIAAREYWRILGKQGKLIGALDKPWPAEPSPVQDRKLLDLVREFWALRPMKGEHEAAAVAFADRELRNTDGAAVLSRVTSSRNSGGHIWFRIAEDYLALRCAELVDVIVAQIRLIIMYCTVTALLLGFALVSYPFEPHYFMMAFVGMASFLVIVVTVSIFIGLNRDEVVSRLIKTDPGRLNWNWDFVSRILLYGVLPVVGFISAEFPRWTGSLGRLASQIFHILK